MVGNRETARRMISRVGSVTARELLNLKEDGNRYELIAGELKKMSPAGSEHGRIAGHIFAKLYNHVQPKNLGQTFAAETGFRIATNPDTVRAPDAAFVSHEQLASVEGTTGYLPLAPDLVVEVVSPTDTFSDVESKAPDWLEAGCKIVIVAEPRTTTLHIYREANKIDVLQVDDVFDAGEVAGGWTLSVRDAFGI